LSNRWGKLLESLIDKKITMVIVKAITGDSWMWYGYIREYVRDEINGGYIIFEHFPTERVRLQTKRSYLHLGTYNVGLIDELNDDYEPEMTTQCPSCSEKLKLEEVTVKVDEKGEEESHIILLPMNLNMANQKKKEE
jgi:hypothetical protein